MRPRAEFWRPPWIRNGEDLLARFHGARPGGDNDFAPADFHAAAQVNDRALRLELAAGQLERLGDAHHLAHALQQLKIAVIEIAMDAHGAENGVAGPGRAMHVKAAGDHAVNDVLNLLVGGSFMHDDDHDG